MDEPIEITSKTLSEVLELAAGSLESRIQYGACGSHEVYLVHPDHSPPPPEPRYEPELNRALREGTLPTQERF